MVAQSDNATEPYHAFGLIGTTFSKKISVFQSSSLKVVPISPNASCAHRGELSLQARALGGGLHRRRRARLVQHVPADLEVKFTGLTKNSQIDPAV